MKTKLTSIVLFLMLAVVAISGVAILTISAPTSTAQVGIAYSSSCAASGGVAPYTYSISAGALPGGLGINSTTGVIAGTPTTAGQFQFTCFVTDSFLPPIVTSPNTGEAAARSRSVGKSSSPQTSSSSTFTITVAAAPSPTPVPPSIWMAMMGLAGAGLFRMRQMRRG